MENSKSETVLLVGNSQVKENSLVAARTQLVSQQNSVTFEQLDRIPNGKSIDETPHED